MDMTMDELIRAQPEYEMRLYNLSLVTTSISFWERQEIRTEVLNFFTKNFNYEWKPKEWHEITKKVLNFADTCGLVATVLLDLKDAIINTGMKMFDWIMYVHWDYGLDINHALPILWTPLGFVDEEQIFKTIWVNDDSLYHDSPDKPIFRLACLLAQEDFIREHESEMIEELKKLPMEANSDDDVELEVVDYSDKVYGIISTYISYFVYRDWEYKDYYFYASGIDESKEELEQSEIQKQYLYNGITLHGYMEETMKEGWISPPEIMAKLSGWPGLLHAVKYYFKKLKITQKKEIDKWLLRYVGGRSYLTAYNVHCRAWRFWEMRAFVTEHCDHEYILEEDYYLDDPLCRLLYLCPLETVLWPMVIKLLNDVETTSDELCNVLEKTFHFMEVDLYFGIPNTRYFYQKLVKKIFATCDRRKMQGDYQLWWKLERYCIYIRDFTMIRKAYKNHELIKLENDAERFRTNLFSALRFYYYFSDNQNFEVLERFFEQLFVCPDDRICFLVQAFSESYLLRKCLFDIWEELYSTLNVISAPLRASIDPIKCLCSLASDNDIRFHKTNVEKCDEFIKWWHKSNEEDQKNLKDRFKQSSYLSKCIYEYWNDIYCKPETESLRLLQWLFDSEDEIKQFKKERLSILGLFDISFTYLSENKLFNVIDKFIIFSEMTAESLANAKDEISSKIEELIYSFLTVHNIENFNFLMNWVSISEGARKKIFQNLMDSSKMLKLCEQVLNNYLSEKCLDVFYNEWVLKYCNDISKLKHYLVSNYKGLRSTEFILKFSSMYETLERGERLENIENL